MKGGALSYGYMIQEDLLHVKMIRWRNRSVARRVVVWAALLGAANDGMTSMTLSIEYGGDRNGKNGGEGEDFSADCNPRKRMFGRRQSCSNALRNACAGRPPRRCSFQESADGRSALAPSMNRQRYTGVSDLASSGTHAVQKRRRTSEVSSGLE